MARGVAERNGYVVHGLDVVLADDGGVDGVAWPDGLGDGYACDAGVGEGQQTGGGGN